MRSLHVGCLMLTDNLISERVNELDLAARDIDVALADLKGQIAQLEDARLAILSEHYQLTEMSAPGPLFSLLRGDNAGNANMELRV